MADRILYIEDEEVRQSLMRLVEDARQFNQNVGCTPLRHKIDEYLTRAYLLARNGNEGRLNGGKK